MIVAVFCLGRFLVISLRLFPPALCATTGLRSMLSLRSGRAPDRSQEGRQIAGLFYFITFVKTKYPCINWHDDILKPVPVHNAEHEILVKRIEEGRERNFEGEHRHAFYELLYFTEVPDDSFHFIDFEKHPVCSDYLYVLKPGQAYDMELTEHKGFLVAVRPEYFRHDGVLPGNWLGHIFPDSLPVAESDSAPMRALLELLEREYSAACRKELLAAYMNSLLAHMEVVRRERDAREGISNRMHKLLELIEMNYIRHHDADFYAASLSLGKKRLNVLSVEAFGQTVKQLIQQRLLLQAKRLIGRDSSTFKEIAQELGFKDASYFSRFFRQNSGITPEAFRQSLK